MRLQPVDIGVHWYDAMGIYGVVTIVIMAHDMLHSYGLGDPWILVELAGIGPEVGVVADPLQVAFEVQMIHRVKAQQRGEKAPIGFGQPIPHQVAVL